MLKEGLMVRYRLQSLSMLGGVLQDLEARHDTSLDFIEYDVPAEFDQRAAFMPGNGAGVWLKEAEHFLACGHLLALQHARACLGDDALNQREHSLGLFEQALGLLLGPLIPLRILKVDIDNVREAS